MKKFTILLSVMIIFSFLSCSNEKAAKEKLPQTFSEFYECAAKNTDISKMPREQYLKAFDECDENDRKNFLAVFECGLKECKKGTSEQWLEESRKNCPNMEATMKESSEKCQKAMPHGEAR